MTTADVSNWGRWHDTDGRGTTNLIGQGSVVRAAALVKTGVTMSLAHPLALEPGPGNPSPVQRTMRTRSGETGGAATESLTIEYHGLAVTHLDALCHVWGAEGTFNGHSPTAVITDAGATWGDVTEWRDGIVTRAVLVDIPAYRSAEYVEVGDPVTAADLAAATSDTPLGPGDAVIVYSGRDRWDLAHDQPWGSARLSDGTSPRPGLHVSCAEFFRERDVGVLVWDMMDAFPADTGRTWPVHSVIHDLGLPLIDNAYLSSVVEHSRATGTHEFMLTVGPLVIPGGTGSPVNPIAIF
jgi:kynurenine formamidase